MKFEVKITETLEKVVTVEANNRREAIQIASDNYDNSEEGYILYPEDHIDTTFKAHSVLDNFTFKDKIAACAIADKIITTEHFSLKIDSDTGEFYLHDKEGANFGDIQSDRFSTLMQVIDRLDIYHEDYFFKADDVWDRIISVILKSDYFANLLDSIDSNCYEDFLNEFYSLDLDPIWFEKIILEKIIALKTISTLSAYVMIEYNDSIYISDYAMYDGFENPKDSFLCDIIEFENNNEYRLQNQQFFQKYNTYSDVIDTLRLQIKDDIRDLGIKDFYLSEEELKYLNISEDLWKN